VAMRHHRTDITHLGRKDWCEIEVHLAQITELHGLHEKIILESKTPHWTIELLCEPIRLSAQTHVILCTWFSRLEASF
jgi:hypothetical protein